MKSYTELEAENQKLHQRVSDLEFNRDILEEALKELLDESKEEIERHGKNERG
jgi:chaperonin cofactor prefoldin